MDSKKTKTSKIIKPGDVRVRIAPSPTGPFHIGTARTALFNYLFAKKYDGSFVLRIEDTDLERSDTKYEKDITENLRWLGLEWDEGVEVGGEYAPYRQSERIYTYAKYIEQLLKEDKAYHCFCTEEELEAQRQDMFARSLPPKYSGRCRNLDRETIKKYQEEGKPSIIRFAIAPNQKIVFKDLIRGKIEFDTTLIGDIAIAKNIGIPLYNFAVVIDDYLMKISHVIRGEDHISNTPKQILIQQALGFPQPEYAHLPLILGSNRQKMSKRQGKVAVSEYRKMGYLPEALVNFIALLGWNPKTDQEFFSLKELIEKFDLANVQKAGAIFNIEKLNWLNGHYIRQMKLDELTELCLPFLKEKGYVEEKKSMDYIRKIIGLEQERLKTLSEIGERTQFFFKEELSYDSSLLRWKNMPDEEIKQSLDKSYQILSGIESLEFTMANLKKFLMPEAEKIGDRGNLFWPLRVALTGLKASPDPFEIMEILGKEKTLQRIKGAKEKLL